MLYVCIVEGIGNQEGFTSEKVLNVYITLF